MSVSDSGLATAVSNGTTTISATAEGVSGTATVAVVQGASAVAVAPGELWFTALGDTARLRAAVHDAGGAAIPGATVAWSSSDSAVAVADSLGLVTSVGNGRATITAASGEASGTALVEVAQQVATVRLSPGELSFTALGDTARLRAAVHDAGGAAIPGATVAWSSSDSAVAVADSLGLVTSVGNGRATITAASGEASGTALVEVAQQVATVRLSPGELSFTALGDTARLRAAVHDAGGAAIPGATVAWSSSDSAVAVADSLGLVTSVGNGRATITAASGEASGTALVEVAQQVARLVGSHDTLSFTSLGDTTRVTVTPQDSRGNTVPGVYVIWAQMDSDVAVVSESGLVTAIGVGDTEVIAFVGRIEHRVHVRVRDVPRAPASVEVSPSSVTLTGVGQTAQLAAVVRDGQGAAISGAAVSWRSSATGVATVSSGGLVTAVDDGQATITAASGSASGTATVTVRIGTTSAPASVEVSPSSVTLTGVGQTAQLAAVVRDGQGAAISGAAVSWRSSATGVATVSSGGLVTAVDDGQATITAASGSASGTATVTVRIGTTSAPASVEVSPSSVTLTGVGQTAQLAAVVRDGQGAAISGAAVSWRSSATGVATVSSGGLVTAVDDGQATITAASGSASGTATVTVRIGTTSAPASVEVSPSSVTLTGVGQTAQLAAVVRDGQGAAISGAAVSWRSSATGVATVSSGGLVTAVDDGQATITAASGSASGTATVTVRIGTTPSVAVSPATATLDALGATLQLTARDENGSTITHLSWASDNADIATVSGSGLVTALAAGEATITATAGSAQGTSVVVVRQLTATVSVSPSALALEVGQTGKLTAEVHDANGNPIPGAPINWSTEEADIAVADESGLVTALAVGSTTVIVTSDHASTRVPVRVVASASSALRLIWHEGDPSSDQVVLERPLVPEELKAEYTDPSGTRSLSPREVAWTSADTMIAIVRSGIVRGIRAGRTTITADFEGFTAEMPVQVFDWERAYLVGLYHRTDGDNWTNNDGWLSDRPHWASPGWYGVTAVPFRDDVQVPPNSYRARLLEEAISTFGDTLPPTVFAQANDLWANADPDSLERALIGRVVQLDLNNNNLRGEIQPNLGFGLKELMLLNLNGNEIHGSLNHAFFQGSRSLFVLSARGNQLSGPMPDYSRTNIFLLDLSGNQLSGAVPELAPFLFAAALDNNRLTGQMPDLTLPRHARIAQATWYGNDGLCHPDSPAIRDAIINRNIFRFIQGPVCGLDLDSRKIVVVDPERRGVRLTFDAARDSSEVQFKLLDIYGQEVPQGRDSVRWESSDSSVVTIAAHSGRTFLRSEGTGIAEVSVAEPILVSPVKLLVSVDQVPTSLQVDDQTALSNSVAEWTAIANDRNGVRLARLPLGSRGFTSDSTVAVPYRNGVLETFNVGSTRLTVVLPNGLTASGALSVTAGSSGSTIRIDSIKPAVLIQGMEASMWGEGLRRVDVLVDGRVASTRRRRDARLYFTPPEDAGCLPTREVAIVARDANGGALATGTLKGRGETVTLLRGASSLLDVPTGDSLCVQLDASAEHLVLAQALPDPGVVMEEDQIRAGFVVRASGLRDDQAAGNRAPRSPQLASAVGPVEDDNLIHRHRIAEGVIRDRERTSLSDFDLTGLAAAGARRAPVIDANTAVGDTVTLVSDFGQCEVTSENTMRAVVRGVGTYSVIVGDLDNVIDYTNAQYQGLLTDFERIVPELTKYFGSFTDVNADNRVTAVFSDKVALENPGLLGYVSHVNLFPKTLCAASDEMEMFFGRTPDANTSYDKLRSILPALVAHELTHVIQGRRVNLNATTPDDAYAALMELWLAEGQAQLGQEIVGYALGRRGPGNNYTSSVALGEQDGVEWYADSFGDLRTYLSGIYFGGGSAPSACSWWARSPAPCQGRSLWYGVSWSFLRWISDHYGAHYAGGEAGLQTAIVDGRENAWELLARLTGEQFGTLLSGWGASLLLDERLASGPYTLPSWNLTDIKRELRISFQGSSLAGFEEIDRVVLGSSKYFSIGGRRFPRSALAIRGLLAISPDAGLIVGPLGPIPLPIGLQVLVVRVR